MANIPGATNILPSVVTDVVTQSTGTSVPGGIRVAAIIGEGARGEVIVPSASGGGTDGLDSTYISSTGADGRHFALTFAPVVSNRTQLFKNGVLLVGLEAQIDNSAFSNAYDYRIDIATGHIELQKAHLVDQGGSFYAAGATNVGVGYLSGLSLDDVNAPPETWTLKCVSVQRNNLNQPIAGTAKFVAFGSVSGNVLDSNGNPVIWTANGSSASNGILTFAVNETLSGLTAISPFREGDYFTVKVASGVLVKNDSLTASYIAVADLNDPTFLASMKEVAAKHGSVTLDNTLSLGCQLAFANATPGVMCVQAAPSLPRRSSYTLETSFPATSTNCDDFIIPLPLGVSPDPNSNIHIFVTNPATKVETQKLANKYPFFTLGTAGHPSVCTFVNDALNPPSGNAFSYSVIQQNATLNFAQDGYLNRNLTVPTDGYFTSASANFDSSYVGKTLNIIDATNLANIGSFPIVDVAGGALQIVANGTPPFADFINEGTASFQLIDSLTGDVVPSSSGTVSIVAVAGTATANLTASIDLTTFDPYVNGYKLKITSATNATNVGLFDITSFSAPSTLSVAKSFVSEHNLKYEVIDSTLTSDYLVLNKSVVPNGYTLRVTLVDVKDASFYDAGWENALASLETQEVDIVVPLPKQTISVIFQNALNHCLEMSNNSNKKERVLFCGAINGLTPDNVTGAKSAAVEDIGVLEGIQGATVADVLSGNTEDLTNYSVKDAFGGTYRAVYFYPDQIVAQVGTDNQIISGYYMAAAAAGKVSGTTNIAMPLTNKVLSGFTILKNRMFRQRTLEAIAASGISVVQPVTGGGLVLWGKTTTQSGYPEEEEISIIFIRDRLAKSLRTGFQGYIGNPEDLDTAGTLYARGNALMNSFISQKLITDFADLTIVRDSIDPRQWNISVRAQVVYPINWIYIKVGIGTI